MNMCMYQISYSSIFTYIYIYKFLRIRVGLHVYVYIYTYIYIYSNYYVLRWASMYCAEIYISNTSRGVSRMYHIRTYKYIYLHIKIYIWIYVYIKNVSYTSRPTRILALQHCLVSWIPCETTPLRCPSDFMYTLLTHYLHIHSYIYV